MVSWNSFYFWSIGAHTKSGNVFDMYILKSHMEHAVLRFLHFFIHEVVWQFSAWSCFSYHYLQCLYCLWNECWIIHCANSSLFCEKAHFEKCESALILNVSNAKQWLFVLPAMSVGCFLQHGLVRHEIKQFRNTIWFSVFFNHGNSQLWE